jgi:hypothetical protein
MDDYTVHVVFNVKALDDEQAGLILDAFLRAGKRSVHVYDGDAYIENWQINDIEEVVDDD